MRQTDCFPGIFLTDDDNMVLYPFTRCFMSSNITLLRWEAGEKMNRARSQLTGKLVNAKNTNKNRAKYHKVVCPECFEPVALVKKNAKQYFAHCPFKETSPYCLWRIIRDSGKPVAIPKPPPLVRPILKPGVFQKALRIAFGVASLRPLPSPYQPSAKKLVKLMQSVWSKRKQCVNISDSISPSDEYLRKWTSAGRQIRIYEAERARNFPYLASKFKLPKNLTYF